MKATPAAMPLRSVCVFCGSSPGHRPEYTRVAWQLGQLLATRGITLVYGGAQIGLMGSIADAALSAGGKVIGVLPRILMDRELGHHDLTELHVVDTMAERKDQLMALADAFIALPGSIGTLDELFEVWTCNQLGLLAKPCGLLNVDGYYDSLLAFLERAVSEGFLRQSHRDLLCHDHDVEGLLTRLTRAHSA